MDDTNFFKCMYDAAPTAVRSTMDVKAEDDPRHMERYHPHGFDPSKDHCVLVDRDKGMDALSATRLPVDRTSPHYYEDYSKGKSLEEMKKWLEENCGGNLKCIHIQTRSDFSDNGMPDRIIPRFLEFGNFPTKNEYEDSCRRFFEVVRDLRKRFPQAPIDIDWYVPFNFSKGKGGSSTLDRRNKISYIGNIANLSGLRLLGADDSSVNPNLIYDITRHEIGHNLSTYSVLEKSISAIDKLRDRIGDNDMFKVLYQRVSPYASLLEANLLTGKIRRLSMDYLMDMEEVIAEVFSRYTSPNYKKGNMPEELESISEMMVTPQHHNEKEKHVMDSIEEEKTYAEKHPEWWEEFIKYNSIYYGRGPTKYGYWDRHTDKWVEKPENSLWARLFQEMENGTFTTVEAVREKYGINV